MKVSDSVNLAKVLSNFNQYRKGTVGQKSQGRGSSWKGVKYLENVDHSRVAETLLNSRNWHNRTAVSAMMEMASIVEHFLALRLTWDQRKELGRVLISSLTYSGLYYMHREPPDDPYASYRIYKTDTTREEYDYPWHSSPVPFSKWANLTDANLTGEARLCLEN